MSVEFVTSGVKLPWDKCTLDECHNKYLFIFHKQTLEKFYLIYVDEFGTLHTVQINITDIPRQLAKPAKVRVKNCGNVRNFPEY